MAVPSNDHHIFAALRAISTAVPTCYRPSGCRVFGCSRCCILSVKWETTADIKLHHVSVVRYILLIYTTEFWYILLGFGGCSWLTFVDILHNILDIRGIYFLPLILHGSTTFAIVKIHFSCPKHRFAILNVFRNKLNITLINKSGLSPSSQVVFAHTHVCFISFCNLYDFISTSISFLVMITF